MKTPEELFESEVEKSAALQRTNATLNTLLKEQYDKMRSENNLLQSQFDELDKKYQALVTYVNERKATKTLRECKEQIARKHGYINWEYYFVNFSHVAGAIEMMEETAELYAEQFKQQNKRLREDVDELLNDLKAADSINAALSKKKECCRLAEKIQRIAFEESLNVLEKMQEIQKIFIQRNKL